MNRWVVAYNARSNGLGNRLRATLGARNLAVARGRRLAVVWPTGPLFQPRFGDLFEGTLGVALPLGVSQALSRVYPFRDEHLRDIDDAAASRVWQIRTGGVLELPDGVRSWEEDLRELRPVAAIGDTVRRVHEQFGDAPYLGVQVRTHAVSHDKTREASPVEWFQRRLDEIRTAAPDLRFFFSCDVPGVQDDLVARYPGSLGLTDKGPYNSVSAVQNAVADLYLLASSAYILGPAHSSFVELAVRLANHGIPFENSLKDPGLDLAALSRAPDPLTPSERA